MQETATFLAYLLLWVFVIGALIYGIKWVIEFWSIGEPFNKLIWAVVFIVCLLGILNMLGVVSRPKLI